MGLFVVSVYWSLCEMVDQFIYSVTYLRTVASIVTIVCLLLCPQPRPPTPTFMQNSLLLGLLVGLAVGTRDYYDAGLNTPATSAFGEHSLFNARAYFEPSLGDQTNMVLFVIRTLLGYAFVLSFRVAIKGILSQLCSVISASCRKQKQPVQPEAEDAPADKSSVRQRKTKTTIQTTQIADKSRRGSTTERIYLVSVTAWDLIARCAVKTVTYTGIAYAITFIMPVFFHATGLAMAF